MKQREFEREHESLVRNDKQAFGRWLITLSVEEKAARVEAFKKDILPISRFVDILKGTIGIEPNETITRVVAGILHMGPERRDDIEHHKGYLLLTDKRFLFTDIAGNILFHKPLDAIRAAHITKIAPGVRNACSIRFDKETLVLDILAALPADSYERMEGRSMGIQYDLQRIAEGAKVEDLEDDFGGWGIERESPEETRKRLVREAEEGKTKAERYTRRLRFQRGMDERLR